MTCMGFGEPAFVWSEMQQDGNGLELLRVRRLRGSVGLSWVSRVTLGEGCQWIYTISAPTVSS